MTKLLLHIAMVLFIALAIIFAILKKIATLPIAIWLDVNDLYRKTLHDMPQRFRKYLPYYDSCGLRHSHLHIDSIDVPDFFWSKSFEEQAEYASEFIVLFCKKGHRSNPNLAEVLPPLQRNDITVTGIANAAYVILNHPSMEEREQAYKSMNEIEAILTK